MLKQIIIASALVVGLAAPAWAGSCPGVSKQVSAGLAKSTLPAAKKAEIMKLRNQGDMLHRTGKHGQSVAVLKRAMSMLGK
ncbi:MAG TPA: hypothetical protein VM325_08110 [Alphaproteobacteria bacterium]|nr:hypothetical protein [Alphaproteobacteria bacterium]